MAVNSENYYRFQDERIRFSAAPDKLLFRCHVRPAFEGSLSTKGVAANMVFLLALILATPGMRPLNRLIRMLAAGIMLFFSHLLFIITKVEITLLTASHPLAGWEGFWRTTDNFLEVTGKVFFPIVIWLLLTLPYMMGMADRRPSPADQTPVGRNDPCPCRSGKKYKHCCGRV